METNQKLKLDGSEADDSTIYQKGDEIFQKGEKGGDLYFIQEGTVEVYTTKDSHEIVLSEMGPGEILGVITCLTSAPRLAAARAKTKVSVKIVKHESIQKVLRDLPEWLNVVIKEFTIRLAQMNDSFSELKLKQKALEDNQISRTFIASQLAGVFANICDSMSKDIDGVMKVEATAVITKAEAILGEPKENLDAILEILARAGLLKLEVDQVTKKSYVKTDTAKKLQWFAQFVRESRHGKKRRVARAKIAHKEKVTLRNVVKYAQKKGGDLTAMVRIPMIELKKGLDKQDFEPSAFETAKKYELILLEGGKENPTVAFVPTTLGRTLAAIDALRALEELEDLRKSVAAT